MYFTSDGALIVYLDSCVVLKLKALGFYSIPRAIILVQSSHTLNVTVMPIPGLKFMLQKELFGF